MTEQEHDGGSAHSLSAHSSSAPPSSADASNATKRRDLLARGTVALGCAGACALAVPFVNSLRPDTQGTRAEATLDVDLAGLAPGDIMTVQWRDWPVFILHRTPPMLAGLQAPEHLARLKDPASKIMQQPKDATNWHRSVRPDYGVLIGICTHLGCVPTFERPDATPASGGYSCPCHGSHFDMAGRVLMRSPAPYNLPVPPVTMLSETSLRIGHSTADPEFGMSDIQQI